MKGLSLKKQALWSTLLLSGLLVTVSGCKDDENLYNPAYVEELKSQLFDFDMTQDVMLNINYNAPGSAVLVSVYDEYPYNDSEENVDEVELKSGLTPIYQFNLKDGRYDGTINIPATVSNVWLVTGGMGLPTLAEASVSNNTIAYTNSDETKSSRAYSRNEPANNPTYTANSPVFDVEGYPNVKTLFRDWNKYGEPWDNNYITNISQTEGYNATEFGNYLSNLGASLWQGTGSKSAMKGAGLDNSHRAAADESKSNINIIASTYTDANGNTVTANSAKLTLTFVDEYNQTSMNVFGYYYYPTGTTPTEDNITKFIVFPNVTAPNYMNSKKYVETYRRNCPLQTGDQVVLKYYDEATGTYTDRFPAGLTIGWFIYYNGFNGCDTDIKVKRSDNSSKREDEEKIYSNPTLNLSGTNNNNNGRQTVCYYSNPSMNPNGESRCMIITDTETGRNSVSFEDWDDKTFDDIIFYVESDIKGTLVNNSGETTGDTPDHINSYAGTYAFEDIWSSGGDYDMNDVVVEYSRDATITCHNEVRAITETYKLVHNGATYEDGFGVRLPYETKYIKSITVNGQPLTATDGDVFGYKGNAPRWEAAASTDTPTLVFFDNINSFGSLRGNAQTYKVKVEFNVQGSVNDSIITVQDGTVTGTYIDANGNTVEYEVPKYSTTTTSRNQYPTEAQLNYARNNYDPFIIVYSLTANKSDKRLEVHLPKKSVTLIGDPKAGQEWNLWFVGRFEGQGDRQFPFAIDLPVSCNPTDNQYYQVAKETVLITNAYPDFAGWTDSHGSEGNGWYLGGVASEKEVVQAYQ